MADVYVAHWGESGPRVVLVHGGAQGTASAGHKNFWAQESLAAAGWQLIVPDRPGHGRSPNPGRGDNAAEDGKWAAELLGDGAHLVGHSYGGLVALAAAARRPQAVKSLTLIEPALHKVSTRSAAVRKVVFGLAVTMILPFSPTMRARRAMKLLGIPASFERSDEDIASLGRSLGKSIFPTKRQMLTWLGVIKAARIPLLVISGDSSPSFMAIAGIAAELGGGTSSIVPSEHHFPQWSGAPFNKVLTDFWENAEASGAAAK